MSFTSVITQQKPERVIPTASKKRDWNIILLFANIASVIISYGAAGFTAMASNAITKPLRIMLLAFSLYYLFFMTKKFSFFFRGQHSWCLWVFILLNMYVLPFSYNFLLSAEKWINLWPFLIYINYIIVYLYRNYDREQILGLLLNFFNIVYAIPVVSFFLFGGKFSDSDIYGEVVGGFANNHYGWACSLFLATSIDLLRSRQQLSPIRKKLIYVLCPLAVIILAISGSRSGYLTFALCFLIFVLRNSNAHIFTKFIATVAVAFFVLQLYGDPESALNKRLDKTEEQLEKGEARTKIANLCWEAFGENPSTLTTGFGFYAFKIALQELNSSYDPEKLKINLHNSYYELLFGSGMIVFVFFLLFFVIRTLVLYLKMHASKYIFLPPVMLIPLFENNFNPGQFMFFPWFLIMFYYLHYREKQIPIQSFPSS